LARLIKWSAGVGALVTAPRVIACPDCLSHPFGSLARAVSLHRTSSPARLLYHFLFFVFLWLLPIVSRAQYLHHGDALLPNPKVTPGKVNPAITKEIACSTKWGKDERLVSEKMKDAVYAAYGTAPKKGACALVAHKSKNGKIVKKGCEVDHLISRELGGADDPANLWPQPYWTPDRPGAYQKDKLENWLHGQICAGKISLADAQAAIVKDWYALYLKMEAATQ
jgi:hypothetical protein